VYLYPRAWNTCSRLSHARSVSNIEAFTLPVAGTLQGKYHRLIVYNIEGRIFPVCPLSKLDYMDNPDAEHTEVSTGDVQLSKSPAFAQAATQCAQATEAALAQLSSTDCLVAEFWEDAPTEQASVAARLLSICQLAAGITSIDTARMQQLVLQALVVGLVHIRKLAGPSPNMNPVDIFLHLHGKEISAQIASALAAVAGRSHVQSFSADFGTERASPVAVAECHSPRAALDICHSFDVSCLPAPTASCGPVYMNFAPHSQVQREGSLELAAFDRSDSEGLNNVHTAEGRVRSRPGQGGNGHSDLTHSVARAPFALSCTGRPVCEGSEWDDDWGKQWAEEDTTCPPVPCSGHHPTGALTIPGPEQPVPSRSGPKTVLSPMHAKDTSQEAACQRSEKEDAWDEGDSDWDDVAAEPQAAQPGSSPQPDPKPSLASTADALAEPAAQKWQVDSDLNQPTNCEADASGPDASVAAADWTRPLSATTGLAAVSSSDVSIIPGESSRRACVEVPPEGKKKRVVKKIVRKVVKKIVKRPKSEEDAARGEVASHASPGVRAAIPIQFVRYIFTDIFRNHEGISTNNFGQSINPFDVHVCISCKPCIAHSACALQTTAFSWHIVALSNYFTFTLPVVPCCHGWNLVFIVQQCGQGPYQLSSL
jgi:hypothetical protein